MRNQFFRPGFKAAVVMTLPMVMFFGTASELHARASAPAITITENNQSRFFAPDGQVKKELLCLDTRPVSRAGLVATKKNGRRTWTSYEGLIAKARDDRRLSARARRKKVKTLSSEKRRFDLACAETMAARLATPVPTTSVAAATATPEPTATNTPLPTATPTPTPIPGLRIEAGGSEYIDQLGRPWIADNFFVQGDPGGVTAVTAPVTDTDDDKIYQTERWGTFSYRVPVAPGNYQVILHFAELVFTHAGDRTFNVLVQGNALTPAPIDIFAETGARLKPLTKSIVVNVASPELVIEFQAVANYPKISGIEIVPVP